MIFVFHCLSFGPASKYWCMHFEAKHSYFKSLAHRVKCFKNSAKTLADHHQHLMCYYTSSGAKFSKDCSFGRVKWVQCVMLVVYTQQSIMDMWFRSLLFWLKYTHIYNRCIQSLAGFTANTEIHLYVSHYKLQIMMINY